MTSTPTSSEAPEAETSSNDIATSPTRWSLARRILFRFVFVHFVVFLFPAPFTTLLPVVGETINDFISDSIWLPMARVTGKYVLRLPEEVTHMPSGSGDTTFDYVSLFITVCIAIIVTAIWSFVQRKKDNHEELEEYFRTWLRYTLATIMIGYGVVKLVKLQFGDPSILQLVKTYGESSPMSLLWTFMGFSTPYTFFGGVMEFIPALMLFSRRTMLLGTLLLMGVLGNVVMLNFCYDVPVKIYSSHLFLITILIAWPDVKRLVQFFLQNAPTAPAPERRKFTKQWMERGRIVAKALFIVVVLGEESQSTWKRLHDNPSPESLPKIVGVYEVSAFTRAGVVVPATLADKTRWHYFMLTSYRDKYFALMTTMTGEKKFVPVMLDEQQKTLSFQEQDPNKPFEATLREQDTEKKFGTTLHFTDSDRGLITLDGKLDDAQVHIELSKLHEKDFLLMNRGFHWVNETPFSP